MALPAGWARRALGTVATGTTSLTISKPAGVVDGDLLVMVLAHQGTGYATVPVGWTLVTQNIQSPTRGEMYWKRASSEPSSYSVTGLATSAAGVITAYTGGPATGSLVDVAVSQANTTTSAGNGTPNLVTTVPRDLLIFAAAANASLGTVEFGIGGTTAFPYKKSDPDLFFLGHSVSGGTSGAGVAVAEAIKIVPGDTVDASVAFGLAGTVNVGMLAAFVPDTGSGSGDTTQYYLSGKLPGLPRREPWALQGAWVSTFEDGQEDSLDLVTTTLLSQTKSDAGAILGRSRLFNGSPYATNLQGNVDLLLGRLMTPPLASQSLSCNLNLCMGFLVRWLSNAGYTTQSVATLKLHVYTTVGQTTTTRTTLLNNYVDATDLPTGTFDFVALTTPQALSGTITAGDSLVVEIGVRIISSPTPSPSYPPSQWTEIQACWRGTTLSNPSSNAGSAFVGAQDAVVGAAVTTNAAPFLSFSQTIVEASLAASPANTSPSTAGVLPAGFPYSEALYDTTQAASNARGVWYRWTPSRTGTAILTARGAVGQTAFEAYTGGPSYASLVAVPGSYAVNTQAIAGRNLSVLRVPVVAGTTYYLRAYSVPVVSQPQIPAPSSGGTFNLNIDYVETPLADDVYVAAQNITAWRNGRLVNIQPDFAGDTPSGITIDYTQRPMNDQNGGVNTDYRLYVALFGVGNDVEILDLTTLDVDTLELDFIVAPLALPSPPSDTFTLKLAALQLTRAGMLYVQTFGDGFLRVCGIAFGIPSELSAPASTAAMGAIRGIDATHGDNQPGAPWPLASVLTAPAEASAAWAGGLALGDNPLLYTSGGVYLALGGTQIRLYNLITQTALGTFATLPLFGANVGLKGLTALPGGGYLVCNGDRVQRLNASGGVIQSYIPPTNGYLVTLSDVKLISSGLAFWVIDLHTATLWQFDVATGALLQTVPTWQAPEAAIQIVVFQPVPFPPTPPPAPGCVPSRSSGAGTAAPGCVPPTIAT